jgi:hypothetical protein
MNELNNYKQLKKIYLILIILIASIPITVLFYGVFVLLYILIPNIYIYIKYYKKNEERLLQIHVRNILKKYLIAMIILFISLIPMITSTFITLTLKIPLPEIMFFFFVIVDQIMILITMPLMVICIITSWVYYLNQAIKASNNIYNLINEKGT